MSHREARPHAGWRSKWPMIVVAVALLTVIGAALWPGDRPASGKVGHDDHFAVGDGQVLVHVPAHPSTTGVVVLHGWLETLNDPVKQGWSVASDRHSFVAIYPQRGDSWNAGLCCGSAKDADRDDVSWLTKVIDRARQQYRLKTIYLAGNSNGGMMVERLIAERPGIARHFAVWAAAPEMPTVGAWTGYGALFSGSNDTVVPRRGGVVRIFGVRVTIRPGAVTSHWLQGAHLSRTVIAGALHGTPPDWPELAWTALSRPQPSAL